MGEAPARGKLSDRLAGKVAIVTGSGSGIGQGCALMFARHGATVIGVDINGEAAEATREAARAEGVDVIPHRTDLTRPAEVEALVAFAVKTCGGIDALVNAAAVAEFVWIEDMDYERHWRRTITGELDTVFLMCKAVWPHMKARGGAIVNLASANSYVALKNSPALAHTAGKGGVLAMTRQLAMEGAPHKIRVNSISPGMIVTGATKPVLERPEFVEAVYEKLMLKERLGKPEDIAWGAVYLASDEASYVTGTDLSIDGGALAW